MSADGSFDIEAARRYQREKEARRQRVLAERLKQARSDMQRIVDHIVAQYRPRRIYQWGSLVDSRHFSEISDIDIAIEGLQGPEQFFAMLGDAWRMTSFPLDIIELEAVSPEQAARIRKKGRLIHERADS